jgi:hypothetical protein
MENPPILDPKALEEIDTKGFCEIQIVPAYETRNYNPGNGWMVLKILQSERIADIGRTMAYQQPGCSPQIYCYTDREILRDISFVIGRREKSLVEDLTKSLGEMTEKFYQLTTKCEGFEKSVKAKENNEAQLKRDIIELESRLDAERKEKDKVLEAHRSLHKEHETLKATILSTLVKLPGGNEATLQEAIGMVKTHEILGGKP